MITLKTHTRRSVMMNSTQKANTPKSSVVTISMRSLTLAQKNYLADFLATSIRMYGWEGAEKTYNNFVNVEDITRDERRGAAIDKMVAMGVITLHDDENGAPSGVYGNYARITKEWFSVAREAYDELNCATYKHMMNVARNNRELSAMSA